MIRAAVVLLVSLALGATAYAFYFHCATKRAHAMACSPDAGMQWLKKEFALTDGQYAKISALHDTYAAKCGEMCSEIMRTNNRLETLLNTSNGTVTPEIKSALAEVNTADLNCRQTMLEHIYAVSREMSPANGERYRRMMEAQVLQRDMNHSSLAPSAAR